ncbi:MAG: hypothetical protein ABI778_02155 [Ignavibacteriota bacterium]
MKKTVYLSALTVALVLLGCLFVSGCGSDSTPAPNNPGSITISTPAAGSVVAGGTKNYQILWTGTNIASQKTIEYSIDNGLNWLPITSINSSATSFSWNVPNVAATKALIRITDGNSVIGLSGAFTITYTAASGSMVITAPVASEVLIGGTQNYQIIWSGTGIDPQKTLDYSLDNGATWTQITTLNSVAFTYNWSIPNIASTKAIVRVTDKNNLTALSGVFTITASAGLAVGETDATIDGGKFKVLNTTTLKSALTVTVTATLKQIKDPTLDSVQLTLVIPIQGSFPYTIDVPTDANSALINYCLKQYPGGFCNSYKTSKGIGMGTITINSLTPIIEGTFSGTLPFSGGGGSVKITGGAFKAQLN